MQLAVEVSSKQRRGLSGTFWLASEANRKQSLVDIVQTLPQDALAADGAALLKHIQVEVDVAVREYLQWLSLP